MSEAAIVGYAPDVRKPLSLNVLVVCCGLVTLAGCGSSATSGAPASNTAPPPPTPAAAASLSAMVLQPSDFPAGWAGAPYKANPDDAASQATLLQCVGARNTDSDKVAEEHSQDFSLAEASVSSQATSYRSQSAIDADLALLRSPKVSSCYEQLIKKQLAGTLPTGATIDSVALTITPGSAGGPRNVAATGQGTINVAVSGRQTAVYQSIAFITGPLIEAQVDFENVGSPLPATTQKALIENFAARVAKG